MMKKIYSKPTTKAIKIATTQVMATSPNVQTLNYAGGNDVPNAPTSADTKGQSIWDMEW